MIILFKRQWNHSTHITNIYPLTKTLKFYNKCKNLLNVPLERIFSKKKKRQY